MDQAEEQLKLRLAGFLIQALSLDDDAATLASEITPLKRDVNAGISTIELASSVGDVAFLLYHYLLDKRNDAGESGRQLFDAGLATLDEAAARGAPGPRLLAHAVTDAYAYMLATTPAAHRALTGQAPVETAGASTAPAADLPLVADRDEARREAASELLRLLRAANAQATTWLTATRNHAGAGETTTLSFNEEETALALYLLDERSIQDLLQALNQLITTARKHSTDVVDKGQE